VRRPVKPAPPPKAQLPQSLRQQGLCGRNSHLESDRAESGSGPPKGHRRELAPQSLR